MVAAAVATVFSCSKAENVEPSQPEKTPIVIKGYTDANVTSGHKSSLGGVSVLWSTTDQVDAFDATGTKVATSSSTTVSSDQKTAEFTFTDYESTNFASLRYPAETAGNPVGTITIPTEQAATDNSFANGANVAFAKVENGDIKSAQFKNLGGLLSIKINNDNIVSVELSANEVMTGAGTLNTETLAATPATDGEKRVVLNGGLENGTDYYAVVYPGSYTGLKIVITDNQGRTATYSNPNTLTVGRNANLFIAELSVPDSKWVNNKSGWYETAITELSSEDVFVIVGDNTDTYALSNDKGTSEAPAAIAVEVLDDALVEPESGIADNIKWTVTKDSDGYTFYPYGETEKWLYTTNANNGVRVGTNDNKVFTISDEGYLFNTATSRYVGIYNSQDWRCYTSINANIEEQTFKFYKYFDTPDGRQEAGMSWSAESATASWDTGDVVSGFTAPTLTTGNASSVTYESTKTEVATINAAGEVTIVGPGETTIKAIFAGNDNYKPQTVSYTLTVTDNRDQVATPVISPDASSTVATGTQVTITCTTVDATIHYTLDGSTPTAECTTYTGAITLTESTTVKAIAIKAGYKNSSIATSIYTVGVVNTSTEENPYSAAEADELAGQLANNGTLSDVYVSGIISEITTEYSSKYNNVSFNISADGLTTGTQFLIFRAPATSANDFKVGDAVEFKGILKNYFSNGNNTHELDADAELIAILHAPTISPNGGTFTESQSVTIASDDGASIFYSTDGSNPTITYSGAITLTETTTIKARATKGILSTGVVLSTFTKSSGGTGTMTLDFESESTSYTDWTFNNMTSAQTGSITAHGGLNYGTTGSKASASLTTKNTIKKPGTLTFYVSKQSTNTTSSSWEVQVSTDGTSWTTVGDTQSATSMSKGAWVEVTRDLSSYSNVYVRVYYSGSTAVRNIDDLSLSYN